MRGSSWNLIPGRNVGVGSAPVGAEFPTSLFSGGITGAWWDLSDHTTTFQDTAGTTPAISAGQTVQRINDKSGNGNHLMLSNGSTLQNSGALWSVLFDGVANALQASFTFSQPITRVTAFQPISTGVVGFWDGLNANSAILYQPFGGGASALTMFTTTPGPQIATSDGIDQLISEFWNGASSTLQLNNGSISTGDPGTPTSIGGATIGANGGLGANGNMLWYASIHIGRQLTSGEMASCHTFFGAKAGLTL